MSFAECTSVTDLCPVEATVYGYRPNLGANIFFLVAFLLCTLVQTFLGIKYKTWSWLVAMFIGCSLEFIGYIGRIIMHSNPWDKMGFQMQIACLIIAPSLISGSIDLVLKHVVLTFGSEYSRIPAKWYTWGFIGADVFSIVLQAVGGGLATAEDPATFNAGNNLMLAGICLQVAQLVVFGIVTAEYGIRTWRHRQQLHSVQSMEAAALKKFKLFAISCTIAYVTILTRCVYRVPELSQGWGGPLMRDETTFLTLDGMMILIASIVLSVFHPGMYFPQLGGNKKAIREQIDMEKQQRDGQLSSGENSDGVVGSH